MKPQMELENQPAWLPLVKEKAAKLKPIAKLLPAIAAGVLVTYALSTLVGPGSDQVSAEESQRIASEFAAGTPAALPIVAPAELDNALVSMALSPDQEQNLRAEITTGVIEMRWLTVLDYMEEDGDIIVIKSGHFSQTLSITHSGHRIPIPVSDGAITVTATFDPGGGVTLMVLVDGGRLPIPALDVGQTIEVPIK